MADGQKLRAKRMPFRKAFSRVDDTLTAQERKTLILHGRLDDLKRDGFCWAVESYGGFKGELAFYLDEKTGRLVFVWIIPEG